MFNRLPAIWPKSYQCGGLGNIQQNGDYLKQVMRRSCLPTGFEPAALLLAGQGLSLFLVAPKRIPFLSGGPRQLRQWTEWAICANFFKIMRLLLHRALLRRLALLGETQEREKVLFQFARRYKECNPRFLEGDIGKLHTEQISLNKT